MVGILRVGVVSTDDPIEINELAANFIKAGDDRRIGRV